MEKHEELCTCECGEITGERCNWTGPVKETVVVYWMPYYLRESHLAAGNSGCYPHNGSKRLRLELACYLRLMQCDSQWTELESECSQEVSADAIP